MSAQLLTITPNVEAVWQQYVDAHKKATRTLDIQDGIAAGHAYRRWLDLFLSDEQKRKLGTVRP